LIHKAAEMTQMGIEESLVHSSYSHSDLQTTEYYCVVTLHT